MNILRTLAVIVTTLGFLGCGLGDDGSAQVAISTVQNFKPATSLPSIGERLTTSFSEQEWSAIKSSETLYRVIYHGSASGQTKELVFGVNINKREVMALNRDALAFTNPM